MRARSFSIFCCAVGATLIAGTALSATGGEVYESLSEFQTTGDFNGDGIADVLIVDKSTGNVRVGFQDSNGGIIWASSVVTGVENPTGLAVGNYLNARRDAVAVTSPGQNSVTLADLSNTNVPTPPLTTVTPSGIGPHTLLHLDPDDLVAATDANPAPSERLDWLSLSSGAASPKGEFSETGMFERGNGLSIGNSGLVFAAGLVRGTTDALHIWQFTNAPSIIAVMSNLAPGSDYAFGRFNAQANPWFAFYLPGSSNLLLKPLLAPNSGLTFGPDAGLSMPQSIQQVFHLDEGTNGVCLVAFTNGFQAVQISNGSPVLGPYYIASLAPGDKVTGVIPVSSDLLVLLTGPMASGVSSEVQPIGFDGVSFHPGLKMALPPVSTSVTRAEIWLFSGDPFTNHSTAFISSASTPGWTDFIGGLPGSVTVTAEQYQGSVAGLSNPTTTALGAAPAGAGFGIPNQYRDSLSLFSYSSPRPPDAVVISISPPPGAYTRPAQISFKTLSASDAVFYRTSNVAVWNTYTAPFSLAADSSVQFYGINSLGARSRLQTAVYTFGQKAGAPPAPVVSPFDASGRLKDPGNVIEPGNTNLVPVSPWGTLFYGRRSTNNVGTIWAINLDGTGDRYITQGARPRVSRDGRYLAFLRDSDPFNGLGSIYLRDLHTGSEQLLLANSSTVFGLDWYPDASALVCDFGCTFLHLYTNGAPASYPSADCYDDRPVVNPVDQRLAFQDLDPANGYSGAGLFVSSSGLTNRQRIVAGLNGGYPVYPSWSRDGLQLSFALTGAPMNAYVVAPDGSALNAITGFADSTNGFPTGTLWSPNDDALIGAGSIHGTNGLWRVALNESRTACAAPPEILPTSPGDPIEFAGSVAVGATTPIAMPYVFLGVSSNALSLSWSTNSSQVVLEVNTNLQSTSPWVSVSTGIHVVNSFYVYSENLVLARANKFFRLRKVGP